MGCFNIAIDGPAGAGKSTIAKGLAKKLGFIYVDTGAMYRAMALYFIRNNVNPEDTASIERLCDGANVTITHAGGEQVVLLNGENVNSFIRSEEVSAMASVSSAVAKVRVKMVELQRELAKTTDVVMDGRDIGSVVLPNADLKIYLTAAVEVRAKRRYDEQQAKGVVCDFEAICENIRERDYRDSHREVSPLIQAEDAVLVDDSYTGIEETVALIYNLYLKKANDMQKNDK